VTILVRPLARCPFRGCPVRYASGGDRLCRDHDGESDVRHLLGYDPLAPDGGDGERENSA